MKIRIPSLYIEQTKSAFAEGNARWTNHDLDPIPHHLRKWGVWSFIAYWISDAFNVGAWQFSGSVIAVGLSWKESLAISALGYFIISFVIALNGATGVIHHAPFPVIARASWGFWGSYVAVISRLILALFWFSINNMNGGNAIRNMIGAIWPTFLDLKNDIPEEQGITTNGMISYIIFFLLQFPFLCFHPNKLRWLFVAKSTVVPIAWVAMLIWAFKSTGGGEIFKHRASVTGSEYKWAFLSSLTSAIGSYSTLSVNQADFSRYSRVSVKWQAMYIPLLPAIFTFVSFIGTAVSSAGQAKYGGDIPWDPNTLISLWENRACRFFAGFSLVLASIGLNISANSLSAANDLTALAPRFINIRRGQLLCGFISWLIMPWKILKSAKVFLNFMSAYAIFLGPIAGIMLADFWVVKCQKYDCMALYHPRGIYRYSNGVNWRAIVAFVAGVAPSLPGLINSVNDEINVGTGVYPYKVGWFLGIAGTSTLYIALSRLFPAPETLIAEEVLPDQVYIQRSENSNTAVNFSREQLKSEVSSNIVHEAKNDAT
ncbi:hypothetical protein LOZ57_003818 [Ophidiomyces ophidiicola]|uniref:uncharacterized protein n=1 Tax=Ophidiomyces ophidiicola TaxID=1387563 RepID=UPI0020C4DFAF|nr:uncharacterized protein LOZ57_003818 [Ophidiomyces ophidiicola]KAI1946067.1 hypothetical protein LOZ57_003818 [Ophidiomyces ophidiicola]KAI2057457.1 hypothetical protein LOZ43_003072 [Ophidiomyces ophidiicola]